MSPREAAIAAAREMYQAEQNALNQRAQERRQRSREMWLRDRDAAAEALRAAIDEINREYPKETHA